MKKTLAALVAVLFSTGLGWAGEGNGMAAEQNPVYLEVAGGFDMPFQNWQVPYEVGGGANFALGYLLGGGLAAQMNLDNYYFMGSFQGNSITDTEFRIIPAVRYNLDLGGGFSPYVLAGTGIDLQFITGPGGNQSDSSWNVMGGVGAQVHWSTGTSFFVESRWNLMIANGPHNSVMTGQDIPLSLGLQISL
jgi:hypothetical protein